MVGPVGAGVVISNAASYIKLCQTCRGLVECDLVILTTVAVAAEDVTAAIATAGRAGDVVITVVVAVS